MLKCYSFPTSDGFFHLFSLLVLMFVIIFLNFLLNLCYFLIEKIKETLFKLITEDSSSKTQTQNVKINFFIYK
jgi:cytoskeletal protein RodZ